MNLSVIIPLLNEQDSLVDLHRELVATAQRHQYQLEIIFVDDGSTDESWRIVESLAASDAQVFGIRLRRNFGKAAAISAGTVAANHPYVVTIDADLQDDPSEIPKLAAQIENGFDVVSGWKKTRRDPFRRRFVSRIFNFLVNTLTKVKLHDHNCGFKMYRREVFDEINLYGGFHRFIPVLAAARGFKVGEAIVHHRPRKHGRSKYGPGRIVKGLLDLITVCFLTGYSHRLQQFVGLAGLLSFLGGVAGLIYLSIYWIVRMTSAPELTPLHQRPIVLYSVAGLLLGAQLLSMGFLAELLIAKDQPRGRRFSIRQTTSPAGGRGDRMTTEAQINESESNR